MNNILYDSIDKNREMFDTVFPSVTCADIVKGNLVIGGRRASIYHINGMLDTESMLRIHSGLLSLTKEDLFKCPSMKDVVSRHVPYTDCRVERQTERLADAILGAQSVLIIDGYGEGLILDTKKYPSRVSKSRKRTRRWEDRGTAFRKAF